VADRHPGEPKSGYAKYHPYGKAKKKKRGGRFQRNNQLLGKILLTRHDGEGVHVLRLGRNQQRQPKRKKEKNRGTNQGMVETKKKSSTEQRLDKSPFERAELGRTVVRGGKEKRREKKRQTHCPGRTKGTNAGLCALI